MRAVDKKLLRDLWSIKGQVLAIALVIASGVATFVMATSTLDSLRSTRQRYYDEYRFPEVFSSLKRAPNSMVERIEEIDGVMGVDTRVVAPASVDVEGFADPVTAVIVSLPDLGEPVHNALFLRKGRLVDPARESEVVISEPFAKAHRLEPGRSLKVTINGRLKKLDIVGIALSPEYIFQIRPGTMIPDFKRYGTFWMSRATLGAAFDMEGAFNDVTLTLSSSVNSADVIDRLDDLLGPYGGLGGYVRIDHMSHRFLSEEFRQLEQLATIFPAIFLGVAAFLLNVVIGRLVNTQREQIAVLKAFGYSNLDVGIHFLKMVAIIVILGIAIGTGFGGWLGEGLSSMYREFYHFPFLDFVLRPQVAIKAAMVCFIAAGIGTVFSLRRAALLSPAVAMRPEPPTRYRETFIEAIGLGSFFSQPTRMILRHLERRPIKSLLTIIGIAMSCSILVMSTFFGDSIDYMIDTQYGIAKREDMSVSLTDPTGKGALFEIKRMEGVEYAEPFRSVPARLRFGHRTYRTAVQGLVGDAKLHRLIDAELKPIELPPEGIVLTDYLGHLLEAGPGDEITVEVLEGSRPVRRVAVVALESEYVGVSGYMEIGALNRLMREGEVISGAHLAIDSSYREEINAALKDMPRVAGIVDHKELVRSVYDTMGEQIFIFTFFITLLASTFALGVVYNSARIALSERGRELASLRVLGFTRAEISYILLGELWVLTLAAIPLGFVIGNLLAGFMVGRMQTDIYRFPLVLDSGTYAFAAVVVIAAAFISAMLVRERLDHLDLIEVLKTKE